MDEWVRWALAAPLPEGHRAIGRHAAGRVLVALAVHANRDGVSWPSADTLATEVSGLTRRDVRNSLEVLAEAGLIRRDGRVGRANRWRLMREEVAGYPAVSTTEVAGYPANSAPTVGPDASTPAGSAAGEEADVTGGEADVTGEEAPALELAGHVAGYMAGYMAGYPAGYPATNGTGTGTGTTDTRSISRSTATAEPLPDGWKPNRTHRGIMRDNGMNPDDVDTLADQFRAAMTTERRREWDPTFAAYIKAAAVDRAAYEFPTVDDVAPPAMVGT